MMASLFRTVLLAMMMSPYTTACSCTSEVTVPVALMGTDVNTPADSVFRGWVVREITVPNVPESPPPRSWYEKFYVVQVKHVYKGCHFKASERIIVTTGGTLNSCSVPFQVNATYAFSGIASPVAAAAAKPVLGKKTRVTRAIFVYNCIYNLEWNEVTKDDLRALRSYNNSKCVALCGTSVECLPNHSCDKGTCKKMT